MTFTEREKYIYHLATLMSMEATHAESGGSSDSLNVRHLINLIQKNRCRKLKGEEIEDIFRDMEEEVMLSQAVYAMDRDDKINKKKFQKRFFRVDF